MKRTVSIAILPRLAEMSWCELLCSPTEVCDGIIHWLMEIMNNYVTWKLVHLTVIVWDIVHNVATKRFNTYIPYITTENMNFLSLRFPSMQIPNLQNISLQSHLLILDMSNSVIMDVCLKLSEAFGLYHSIMVLRLQFNNITYVSNRCFFGLLNWQPWNFMVTLWNPCWMEHFKTYLCFI